MNGSPEYELTWKQWDMPAGLPICALRGRKRPTSDNACTGWPTPDAAGFGMTDANFEERRAKIKAEKKNGNGFGLTLGMAAQLVGWPTPMSNDLRHYSLEALDQYLAELKTSGHGMDLNMAVQLTGWGTPRTAKGGGRNGNPEREHPKARLEDQAQAIVLSGLATPKAQRGNPTLGRQAKLCLAAIPTEDMTGAALSPEFSRWLMGFPAIWSRCAPKVRSRRHDPV